MGKPLTLQDQLALQEMGRDLNSHVHRFIYHDPEHEEFDWRTPTEGIYRGDTFYEFENPQLLEEQNGRYTQHPVAAVRRAVDQIREFGISAVNIGRINSDKNRYAELHYLLNNSDSSNVPRLYRAISIPALSIEDMQRHLQNPESIEQYLRVGQTLQLGARSTTSDPNIAAWWHGSSTGVLHSLHDGTSKPSDYDLSHLPKHLITLHLPEQSKAVQIVPLVPHLGQCEYIISPSQQFKVSHYGGQDDNFVHHFYLESSTSWPDRYAMERQRTL